jgi:hypothetical protein
VYGLSLEEGALKVAELLVGGALVSILPTPLTPAPELFPSENQTAFPTVAIPPGTVPGGSGISSVRVPSVVMRPIASDLSSVNHSAPSAPEVIHSGSPSAAGSAYCDIAPSVVTRKMLLVPSDVTHSAPSEPAVIAAGEGTA